MGEFQWIAQFSQFSASAALTAVLGWLLYQMPRHMAEERGSREKVAAEGRAAAKTQADAFEKSITAVVKRAEEATRYEREACERRHKELVEYGERRHQELVERIADHLKVTREVRHLTGNWVQLQANQKAQQEARTSGPGGNNQ